MIELFNKFKDVSGLDTFQSLLADLSPHQMGCLAHILLNISIYYCVMNILSAYYGDVIINYLKLATRYPKLARWIQYRKTYQKYNIPFNLFLILGIVGFTLFVDISVFKHL